MHPLLRGPLSLVLGTVNPRFVILPLELGLGTLKSRFVVWHLQLGVRDSQSTLCSVAP